MEPLLPDFIASARDNLDNINRGLLNLEKEPSDRELLQGVYRSAHSLKGSALTMGFVRMGGLAHQMEDVLREMQKGQIRVAGDLCDALFEANDTLSLMLDTLAVTKRMKVDVGPNVKRLAGLLASAQNIEECSEPEPLKGEKHFRATAERSIDTRPTIPPMDTVRVSTAKLDELANLAGEACIAQNRLASEIDSLMRISDRWQRLKREENLSIRLAETCSENKISPSSELAELGDSLDKASRRLKEAAENASRHIKTLQHRSMETRMLPLSLIFDTLPRVVRDLSRQFSKQVDFEVEGAETIIDKLVLEQIGDPLIHLLRNALDHGIEVPEVRRRSGKSETGRIHLHAKQERGRVIVSLRDDGRGINHHRLKEVAIDKGIVDEKEIEGWNVAQLMELVFFPGLSTSGLVSDISGRGVGLDVVRTNVERLRGQIEVTSRMGKGTNFIMSLPLTLATAHALLIDCAGETLAIPISAVAKSLQVCRNEIRPVPGGHAILHRGDMIPLRSLAAALGWDEPAEDPLDVVRPMLVILQSGERRAGFVVEDIFGEQEIVTRDLGAHLQEVSYVAGATLLGSGEVALILDVPQLFWQQQGARACTAGS
jgi:two-component system chemotaxis sensor kinase CheA